MQQFFATVAWQRDDQDFAGQRYSRAHAWQFDGGLTVPASSSPLSVLLPMSIAANVDPEEALVALHHDAHEHCHIASSLKADVVVEAP